MLDKYVSKGKGATMTVTTNPPPESPVPEKCPKCGWIESCKIGGTAHYSCGSTVSVNGQFIQSSECRLSTATERGDRWEKLAVELADLAAKATAYQGPPSVFYLQDLKDKIAAVRAAQGEKTT